MQDTFKLLKEKYIEKLVQTFATELNDKQLQALLNYEKIEINKDCFDFIQYVNAKFYANLTTIERKVFDNLFNYDTLCDNSKYDTFFIEDKQTNDILFNASFVQIDEN